LTLRIYPEYSKIKILNKKFIYLENKHKKLIDKITLNLTNLLIYDKYNFLYKIYYKKKKNLNIIFNYYYDLNKYVPYIDDYHFIEEVIEGPREFKVNPNYFNYAFFKLYNLYNYYN
jgi:hypothetical protein